MAAQDDKDSFLRGAPDSVKRIAADWDWLYGLYVSATNSSQFTDNVKSISGGLKGAISSANALRSNVETTATSLTATPAFVEQYRETALDFRRRFKGPIVALVAALSVIPAIWAGPGKVEKLRVGARNLVLFGGSTAVVLYPELVMRVAPVAAQSIDSATSKVLPKISK
eukprot:CAMPEP_0115839942 /NCGR_PEP_ID=MMETSP0287-20121206/6517_1 /TAXON_ID=412157 /ORGANISM="Chrysochromulina rotalis, Strain UIO044" /LENGTH=168 /DNA_ID=CAMNT_0003293541 /DNA_START=19 /DNA_END=525 /DNA_ORIENTATION=-